jgi:hypothetical protein
MNNDLHNADELDAFINRARSEESPSSPTPEADLAANLMNLADTIQPDAVFHARLEAHLRARHPSTALRPSPNGKPPQEETMLVHKPLPRLPRQPVHIPWTLTAALAALLIGMTLLVGLNISPSLPQTGMSVQSQTATLPPEPALAIPVGGYVSDFNAADLQKMRDAGITWIGVELPFHTSIPSTEMLLVAESLITSVHNAGFEIFVRVVGTPEDMQANPDTYNNDFGRFVNGVASLGADAIQVWNAQNLDIYWPSDQLDPTAYIDLLKVAYSEIKASNHNTMVITGAPAPTGAQSAFPGQIMNDDLYYQGMAEAYAAVGTPIADCIGMTYVEGIVPPDQSKGDSRDDYPTRYFTGMLRRAHEPFRSTRLPLCITELGYLSLYAYSRAENPAASSLPPLPEAFEWAINTTVEQQAEWTASAIKIASEMSSIQIRMVMIWRINGLPGNTIMRGYSIIRRDGCPACDAIAALRQ